MDKNGNYLFLGVGGMGMAPLACWMAEAGYSISGYDAQLQNRVRSYLEAASVEVEDFVFPEQLTHFQVVVFSSAVSQEHPLLCAARELGLRCLRRGEMLAEVANGKRLIAVVGSHGKTTTTGMIAHGLQMSGLAANYVLGGLFSDESLCPSRYDSTSEWLVAEVDESDGTIASFSPAVTVLLNVDWDHADLYPDAASLDDAFVQLLSRTTEAVYVPDSFSVDGLDGPEVRRFDGAVDRLNLSMPPAGRFNLQNGDAAACVLDLLGGALPKDVLSSFSGMKRRQGVLYETPELSIIEDYAHHPTEIEALIESLRLREPERELVVVFQPHRYSRTRQFKVDFATALSGADTVYLLPVYAAHESALEGGGTSDLALAFREYPPAELSMTLSGIKALASAIEGRPVQLAFVGAGDIEDFAGAFTSWIAGSGYLESAVEGFLRSRVSGDCKFSLDEPLAKKTTMRIGGSSQFYSEPANYGDLQVLLRAARIFELDTFCLGRGSNLLVCDAGFKGLVIRFSSQSWRRVVALDERRIWAAAGGRLKEICGFAAKSGLAGFEFLEGIPGAVGGALRMNAGAMGSWMFDVVERVQLIDEFGQYQDLEKEAFHFGYRKVEEISRGIALGAILRSPEVDSEASIRGRIDSYSSSRKESQPRGASAGCIFKNPDGNYAGKLIDELGIKGMRVGAAEVSDVHGNFIVNHGGATSADVVELVRRVRAKVKADSGYVLEPEVLLVGASWEDVLAD